MQLLAALHGDGVSSYNTITAIQEITNVAEESKEHAFADDEAEITSTLDISFSAMGPSGLLTIQPSGGIEIV